jgi:hypothetical protein
MWAGDFVLSVSRDFVRTCSTPLLVLPGVDRYHPAATGEEIARLARHGRLVEPWKDPQNVGPATAAVRDFLKTHKPTHHVHSRERLTRTRGMATCPHPSHIKLKQLPESVGGCEECSAAGTRWLHLRICLECGHVGCCDESPHREANAHANASGHPIIRSLEPGRTLQTATESSGTRD